MANIEFKGFKLIYANGNSIDKVLASEATAPGTLYLVRTNANGNDGYFVLNKKVYGSGLNTKDYAEGYVQEYVSDMINRLNETVETSGTKYISGTIVEEKGKLKSFAINEDNLTGKFTQIDAAITEITGATGTINDKITNAINALNASVTGTSTDNYITVKVDQANGVLTGVTVTENLGTASKKDVAEGTLSLPTDETSSTKDGLTTAAQVENFVKTSIAGLNGAMHFKGVVSDKPVVADYEAGDVILVGTKEYVLNETGGVKSWVELGDEGIYLTTAAAEANYVKKTTTIAGVDLNDNITKEELLSKLNVEYGAQVNVLEGVKVNGTKLDITNKEVDITVTSGTTNGTISVNGANVAVTGLKSAAYQDDTYFDKAGTAAKAIAEISGSTSGESTNKYVTVTTTQKDGKVTGITVVDNALKEAITGITNEINTLSNAAVKTVNGQTGNTITLTGNDIAVGANVDGDGTMTSGSTVSTVLANIYTKLNEAKADAYTGITGDNTTVTVNKTTHGHSVAVKLKTLTEPEKASGLIQLVSDKDGIYGKLFYDGVEKEMVAPTPN